MASSSYLPCPLCGLSLKIRESVKKKPYFICDPCGMQIFIRKEQGIKTLNKKLAVGFPSSSTSDKDLRDKIQSLEKQLTEKERRYENTRSAHEELSNKNQQLREKGQELAELQKLIQRYENLIYRACPQCGERFQISENLLKTSWFDGRFQGFNCPDSECGGVVPPLSEEN
jgi:predicted  nucleic acid-binding Zn ribbon protein